MQLTGPELEQLHSAIIGAYPSQPSLAMMLTFKLSRNLNVIVGPGSLIDIVYKLLMLADSEGWLFDLIKAASEFTPGDAALAVLVETLRPRPQVAPGPHDVILVRNSAFIDRASLRTSVEEFIVSSATRVLTIDGPAVSGKTYSFRYINYKAETHGKFNVAWVDLPRFKEMQILPELVAESIARQMSLRLESMPRKGDEQYARWIQYYCDWFFGEVTRFSQNPNRNWWIVIDGFSQVTLPQSTTDLINELAVRIDMQLPMIRLVLIGYDDQLLAELEVDVIKDTIVPFGKGDLVAYFTNVYLERQRLAPEKALSNEEIADRAAGATADVVRHVSPDDPRRVERLGRLATTAAIEILNQ